MGSTTEELTVAVPVITVPLVVPLASLTTYVNVAELTAGMFTFVQTELMLAPTVPVRQLHPAGGVSETKVVLFGTGRTSVALSAALAPLFVTTTV